MLVVANKAGKRSAAKMLSELFKKKKKRRRIQSMYKKT